MLSIVPRRSHTSVRLIALLALVYQLVQQRKAQSDEFTEMKDGKQSKLVRVVCGIGATGGAC